MTTRRVVCVVGTRPEAIKMAPVILALRREPGFETRVLASGQHRELVEQMLGVFGINADENLAVMRANQALPELTARLILALDETLAREQPDAVLAQGDTTTVMVTSLVCFYRRIPFGHVEAGLRTGDYSNPFPEEMNRVVAGHLARWHFAPTARAAENLQREGITKDVYVTGNTVIDALLDVARRDDGIGVAIPRDCRLILVTAHRRESFGPAFESMCRAMREIADQYADVHVLYPVHPNPNVQDVAFRVLGGHDRITLCQPLDYGPFVAAMKRAYLLLTDSGGVQEEAPALGKPVLVMRVETERPEAVREGVVRLVGTSFDAIVSETRRLLDDPAHYASMSRRVFPYGDGRAAARIVDVLREQLAGVPAAALAVPEVRTAG
jgi:UDP-N-acetylglucosamine 2-epimerase (non-hydrolysing)